MATYRPADGRHKSTHYAPEGGPTLCGLALTKMRPHVQRDGQRLCKACEAKQEGQEKMQKPEGQDA